MTTTTIPNPFDCLEQVNRWTLDEYQARSEYAEAQIQRQAIEFTLFTTLATWEPEPDDAAHINSLKTATERESYLKSAKDIATVAIRADLRDAKAWELRAEARHAHTRHMLEAAKLAVTVALAMREPM